MKICFMIILLNIWIFSCEGAKSKASSLTPREVGIQYLVEKGFKEITELDSQMFYDVFTTKQKKYVYTREIIDSIIYPTTKDSMIVSSPYLRCAEIPLCYDTFLRNNKVKFYVFLVNPYVKKSSAIVIVPVDTVQMKALTYTTSLWQRVNNWFSDDELYGWKDAEEKEMGTFSFNAEKPLDNYKYAKPYEIQKVIAKDSLTPKEVAIQYLQKQSSKRIFALDTQIFYDAFLTQQMKYVHTSGKKDSVIVASAYQRCGEIPLCFELFLIRGIAAFYPFAIQDSLDNWNTIVVAVDVYNKNVISVSNNIKQDVNHLGDLHGYNWFGNEEKEYGTLRLRPRQDRHLYYAEPRKVYPLEDSAKYQKTRYNEKFFR